MSKRTNGQNPHRLVWAALIGLSLMVVAGSGAVADKPLTLADCRALEADKADAIHSGVEIEMERGPEWAKSNLSADRLREILRFIKIEEMLKFRCVGVFKATTKEKQRKDRQAARRLGIKIPPLPGRNPRRVGQQS